MAVKCREKTKPTGENNRSIRLLEHFVCAGSSALAMACYHLYPHLWPLSVVAFIPFFWRVTRIRLRESCLLGVFLATAFWFVLASAAQWWPFSVSIYKLLILNILFIIYAAAINRISARIGKNAIIIAVAWLPLEYLLDQFGRLDGIIAIAGSDAVIITRIGTLFGALMLAFIVVLLNLLLLTFLEMIARIVRRREAWRSFPRRQYAFVRESIHIRDALYLLDFSRAPPLACVR